MSESVIILTTGGTIDKQYCPKSGQLVIDVPAVMAILGQAGVRQVRIMELMRKDSLEMTAEDRIIVASAVANCQASRVLITHGTDTMSDTAAAIAKTVRDKTAVLTGAMIPHRFPGSDAAFNVGAAFATAKSMDPGVYVSMNGRVFWHDNVRKNKARGCFETLLPAKHEHYAKK